MKIRLAAPLQLDSVVDGEGLRMVLWCQGCEIRCPFCHNPETHDFNGGKEFDVEEIITQIDKYKGYYDGITLTGGHPFLQPDACSIIADHCHEIGMNVWIYSGLIYENIIKNAHLRRLLDKCDVLVDGPFIMEERDITLLYRGSKNQRVIDIKKSLESGNVSLYC